MSACTRRTSRARSPRLSNGKSGAAVRRSEGTKYLYAPAVDLKDAREDALSHLVRTFFQGSAGRAALALLRESDLHLDEAELARLERKIEKVEKK